MRTKHEESSMTAVVSIRNSPVLPSTTASTSPEPRRSEIRCLQDLGDLRQLLKLYVDPLMYRHCHLYLYVADFLDEALKAVVQETMSWARQHAADGRYRDAEYFFRRASSSNRKIPMEALEDLDLYQSKDGLPQLVSIYEEIGDCPAAEMTQETLLRRLFAGNPKHITIEQTRVVYAYWELLVDFRKRVLDLCFDVPLVPSLFKTEIDLVIAYRVAVLDITLLNEVSLEQGLNTFKPNESGCTWLHIAAKENAINLAGLLIKKGADINSRDRGSYTPLRIAAEYAGSAMIELLLANSADVDAADKDGNTPLHAALIGERAQPIVASLINAKGDMDATDDFGRTALMTAIDRDLPAVTLLLLEQGANVEVSDHSKETPLFAAIRSQKQWAIKALLERGASLVGRDSRGDTALHIAVAQVQESIVQILLDHGPMTKTVLDQRDGHERTVLHCAVRSANMSIVKMLLRPGADIHTGDYSGYTALHQAVIGGREPHEHIVRLLLTHSAPLDAVNQNGSTVFHVAVACSRRNMIPILLQHVEPGKLPTMCHMKNNRGETPLDIARILAEHGKEFGNERSVLYLLENALELSHSFVNNT